MATLNKLVELLIPTIEPYVDDSETSARAVLEAYVGRRERGPDEYCTHHVVLSRNGIAAVDENTPVETTGIDMAQRRTSHELSSSMPTKRCIAICYRDFFLLGAC